MKKKKIHTGNPQREEGHTRIANELFDALNKTALRDYERRVFGVIMRETYGWSRREATLSLSKIADAAGIGRHNVPRTLRSLIARNMIKRDGQKFSIQKKYRDWVLSHEITGVSNEITGIPLDNSSAIPLDNRVLSDEIPEVLSDEIPTHIRTRAKNKHKTNTERKIKETDDPIGSSGEAPTGKVFSDGKPDPRDPNITTLIDMMKLTFDLKMLDGNERENRRAGAILIQRLKKIAPAETADKTAWAVQLITSVIIAAKDDLFWSSRLTSLMLLNDKFMSIGKTAIARSQGQTTHRRGGVYDG